MTVEGAECGLQLPDRQLHERTQFQRPRSNVTGRKIRSRGRGVPRFSQTVPRRNRKKADPTYQEGTRTDDLTLILQGALDRERRRLLHWFLVCQITGLLSGGVIAFSVLLNLLKSTHEQI